MTGEITLRGRVLPIGGLKEKLLAAHRSGITTVVVPKENRKDLREVPRRVLKTTRVVLVEHMDDVLREALVLTNPEKMFGPRRERWEYVEGELVVTPAEVTPAAAAAPSAPGSGPGTGGKPGGGAMGGGPPKGPPPEPAAPVQ
jgi:ATP-dependent Lon protease